MSDKYGPWIGWNGGGPPVDENTIVQVMGLRDAKPEQGKARHFNWGLSTAPIIVYRVKLEPEVRRWEDSKTALLCANGQVLFQAKTVISPREILKEIEIKITATQTGEDDPVFEIERVE